MKDLFSQEDITELSYLADALAVLPEKAFEIINLRLSIHRKNRVFL